MTRALVGHDSHVKRSDSSDIFEGGGIEGVDPADRLIEAITDSRRRRS